MLPHAFVTLLTHSSYLPGALVVLHALQQQHPAPRLFKIVCLVTPETVDARSIGVLQNAGFDLVIGVEPISSGIAGLSNLQLMGRTDLDLALTKLHIFRLASMFSKVIYLDADTLPIKPLDHLFDSTEPHTLSACPDIGWPDCFNSGVMVVKPKEADFDGIRRLLRSEKGNSSFDGADQGLLNQYFSEEGPGEAWNRLPFTYNVTPSAAYQYAPAYKHYAHNICVLHFIGDHKPWNQLSRRPAGASGPTESFGYDDLVARWFEVFDRFVRPFAGHDPDVAKRFSVPEHIAVWNQPVENSPESGRLSLDELKAAVTTGVAALKHDHYISMPLEGRVDLMMPRESLCEQIGHGAERSLSPASELLESGQEAAIAEGPPAVKDQPSGEHTHQKDNQRDSSGDPPTQESAWNAARDPPPKHSRPEMIIPMNTVYAPAWDEAPSASATYFDEATTPALTYPTLPDNVKTNDWYERFNSIKPDPDLITKVFPWEVQNEGRPVATRRFPKGLQTTDVTGELSNDLPIDGASVTRQSHTESSGTGGPGVTEYLQSTSGPTAAHDTNRQPNLSFAESIALYTNAWDEVASIHSYAQRLTAVGIGAERRAQVNGLETTAPTPRGRSAATSPYAQSPLPTSPSAGSADGDDEDDRDEGHYAHHRRKNGQRSAAPSYMDREAQTERLNVDATVQTMSTFGSGATVTRRSGGRERQSALAESPTTIDPSDSIKPTIPQQQSSRTWDPTTDVALRRQDSEEVLQRFMQTNVNLMRNA